VVEVCGNVGSCAVWDWREQDGILETDMGFPSRVAAILAQHLHRIRRRQIKLELKFLESDHRVVDAFRRRGIVIPFTAAGTGFAGNRGTGKQGRRKAPEPMGPWVMCVDAKRLDASHGMASYIHTYTNRTCAALYFSSSSCAMR
jgi:hypothetical protein